MHSLHWLDEELTRRERARRADWFSLGAAAAAVSKVRDSYGGMVSAPSHRVETAFDEFFTAAFASNKSIGVRAKPAKVWLERVVKYATSEQGSAAWANAVRWLGAENANASGGGARAVLKIAMTRQYVSGALAEPKPMRSWAILAFLWLQYSGAAELTGADRAQLVGVAEELAKYSVLHQERNLLPNTPEIKTRLDWSCQRFIEEHMTSSRLDDLAFLQGYRALFTSLPRQ